jgi:dTMP kinase
MKPGLIVIEGLDGAGKSTQINLLRNYFDAHQLQYFYIHYPRLDIGVYGQLISKFLRGEFGTLETVHPFLASLLFAGDRRENDYQIRQYINEKHFVLCDRYVYSNIAFQCAKLINENEKNELRKWILNFEYEYNHIIKPDLSVYLNVPLSFVEINLSTKRIGKERRYLNGKKDIHENDLVLQENVRAEYKKLISEESNFISVDCFAGNTVLSPNGIHDRIIDVLHREKVL